MIFPRERRLIIARAFDSNLGRTPNERPLPVPGQFMGMSKIQTARMEKVVDDDASDNDKLMR